MHYFIYLTWINCFFPTCPFYLKPLFAVSFYFVERLISEFFFHIQAMSYSVINALASLFSKLKHAMCHGFFLFVCWPKRWIWWYLQEKKSIRPTFSAERIYGGTLLAMCSNDFICFYDWADCRLIRRIDVNVKVTNISFTSIVRLFYSEVVTSFTLFFNLFRTCTGLTVVIWWQLQVIHPSTYLSTMWDLLSEI